ncbi:hypothetical protein HY224_02825 [Candidatus Uhrbacteria bacterium]|nr:hypothetical protein [Candidatus Uhrbacteria bacterium]
METKQCQNCKTSFQIQPEDFEFYSKLQVPPPTFCPDCRMQRRLAYRNERALYRRKCDLCAKSLISQYPEKMPFPVYCIECWWSDKWDVGQFTQDFDPSKPFLTQFQELQNKIPRPHNNNASSLVNSEYTNCAGMSKNCYLMFGAHINEDCSYSHYINESKDCVDNLYAIKCESCYQCFDIENCYNLSYSQSSSQCHDSMFLFDCRNCSDCIGCAGLRSKQYHILNQPYTKEEYFKKKAELKLDTRSGLKAFHDKFDKEIFLSVPRKYYHGQSNQDSSGDYLANTEKTQQSFYAKKCRNVKFAFWCNEAADLYDYFAWGNIENSYEAVSVGYEAYRCLFTSICWDKVSDLEYCNLCFTSSNLFGCIGLRQKKFCILNKQYSEAEYNKLRGQIIEQMSSVLYKDKQGLIYKYGEFPPIELSPFPYWDTVAQEHFPLSNEEVQKRGYVWRDTEKPQYKINLKTAELPESIAEVQDNILTQVIGCEHNGKCQDQCTVAFKIVPAELAFYRKKGVPLPTLCHNCRHAERVAMRNPLKLWPRDCDCAGKGNTTEHFHGPAKCPNKFETSYKPGRPERVYCEQCYQAEIT